MLYVMHRRAKRQINELVQYVQVECTDWEEMLVFLFFFFFLTMDIKAFHMTQNHFKSTL